MNEQRGASEEAILRELKLREQMVAEREAKVTKERTQNENLFQAIERLKTEHEEERHRLREEHARLKTLQGDVSAESSVLREQLVLERESLVEERKRVAADRSKWEVQKGRECKEIEAARELTERMRLQIGEQLAEAEAERSALMRQLDAERVDLRHLRQHLLGAKAQLTNDEAKLRKDDDELQTHLRYLKERMASLAELGDQVKERSAKVADMYRQLQQEKAEVAEYRERLLQAEQAIASMARDAQHKAQNAGEFEQVLAEKKKAWLLDRQQLLLEKEKLSHEVVKLR